MNKYHKGFSSQCGDGTQGRGHTKQALFIPLSCVPRPKEHKAEMSLGLHRAILIVTDMIFTLY